MQRKRRVGRFSIDNMPICGKNCFLSHTRVNNFGYKVNRLVLN